MSQKRWKLVVSELGQAVTLHEVVVDAGDWMTALTRARAQIGERGGVPPGASCQIAPDGTAAITDAVARRKYVVAPTHESKAPPAAAPAPAPAPAAPLTKKQKSQTMAYMPGTHGPAAASIAVGAPASVHAPAAKQSYSTPEVRAAAQAVQSSPPAPAAPIASAPAPARPASVPPPAAVMPLSKKQKQQTMAYMPAEAVKAMQDAVAAAQASAPPAATAASAAPPPAAAPGSAPPAAAVSGAPSAPPAAPSAAPAATDDGLELLHARDAEPTKESPLAYRERHYLLPPGAGPDDAEMLLRRRFAALREELAARPKGKLVKMAVFDHRWTGQPTRPPVLALQWKDWRGEPEITAPARVSAPSAVAPLVSLPPAVVPAPAPTPSIVVDPALTAPPAPAPAAPAAPSIVVDPSLVAATPLAAAPQAAPVKPAATLPAQPAVAPLVASGSSKRSRKPTPGGGAAIADDRLADAFEGLQDLFFLTSAFEGVEFTMRLVTDLIPCEATSVALYDINSHELRFVATTGTGGEERKGDAIPTTAGLIGAALSDWYRALSIPDVGADARFDPGIDGRVGLDLHNMLLVPVAAQGRLLALVQLINRTGDLQFSQADANLLSYVTSRLGEFLIQTKMAADRQTQPKTPKNVRK